MSEAFSEIAGVPSATAGFCDRASYLLCALLLAREGIECEFVGGEAELPDGTRAGHCWVEAAGLVLDPIAGQFGAASGFYCGETRETALYRYDAEAAGREEGGERLGLDALWEGTDHLQAVKPMETGELFYWFGGSAQAFKRPSPNGAYSDRAEILSAYSDTDRLVGSLVFHVDENDLVIENLSVKPGAPNEGVERLLVEAARNDHPATASLR